MTVPNIVVQMVSSIVSSKPGHKVGSSGGKEVVKAMGEPVLVGSSTVELLSVGKKLRLGVDSIKLNVLLGKRVMVEDPRLVVVSVSIGEAEEERMSELDLPDDVASLMADESEVVDGTTMELASSVLTLLSGRVRLDAAGVFADTEIEADTLTLTGGSAVVSGYTGTVTKKVTVSVSASW